MLHEYGNEQSDAAWGAVSPDREPQGPILSCYFIVLVANPAK